jgi:ABC-type multidrug transport system fused ATPase/permease subunit
MLELEYDVLADDFIDFQMHYFHHSKIFKNQLKTMKFVVAAVYIIAIVIFFILFEGMIKYMAIIFVILFGYNQISKMSNDVEKKHRKTLMKMIEGDKAKKTLGKKKLTIENDTVIYEEYVSNSKINFHDLLKVEESEKSIFLFVEEISAIIVPKRIFETEQSQKAFLELVKPIKK